MNNFRIPIGGSQLFKKIYNSCDLIIRIGAYVSGLFIVIMTILTFYEVISRSFFGKPTTFAMELSIYAIIGSCFLGASYAVRTQSHITVDLLTNVVNNSWKRIFSYLSNALGLIFSILFTVYGFIHVTKTYSLGTTSTSLLRIPMYIPELLLPIGGILLIMAFILQIIDGGVHKGGDHL